MSPHARAGGSPRGRVRKILGRPTPDLSPGSRNRFPVQDGWSRQPVEGWRRSRWSRFLICLSSATPDTVPPLTDRPWVWVHVTPSRLECLDKAEKSRSSSTAASPWDQPLRANCWMRRSSNLLRRARVSARSGRANFLDGASSRGAKTMPSRLPCLMTAQYDRPIALATSVLLKPWVASSLSLSASSVLKFLEPIGFATAPDTTYARHWRPWVDLDPAVDVIPARHSSWPLLGRCWSNAKQQSDGSRNLRTSADDITLAWRTRLANRCEQNRGESRPIASSHGSAATCWSSSSTSAWQ